MNLTQLFKIETEAEREKRKRKERKRDRKAYKRALRHAEKTFLLPEDTFLGNLFLW